jgi:hypothetical protein
VIQFLKCCQYCCNTYWTVPKLAIVVKIGNTPLTSEPVMMVK